MFSLPRRRTALTVSAIAIAAAGAVLATTTFAGAAVQTDLAIATSALEFQPPATIPDTGLATVTVTNVGPTRTFPVVIEVDTASRLGTVTANQRSCTVVSVGSGKDVARCAIPISKSPRPGQSVTEALSVEIMSPPGGCSCVPFTVRLLVADDSNPANNVATAPIIR